MIRKRCGYTLMEIMAVIAAIVILMAFSAKAFRSLASDIPRANRDFQAWIQSQDMLRLLKQDIEHAVSMQLNETGPDSKQLILQLSDGQVVYTLADGSIIRKKNTSQTEWCLPHVKMLWNAWKNQDRCYALEISCWTQQTVLNKTHKQYDQSFVFFLKNTELSYEK